ncbi:DUF29 domain-containing protein [Myxosarcina sp. GI1]|uniref:DUF29 domain-containing protein n=1 Tax=Myxosarcina sp. GI1 TaxID=1541065 RepID=UPI000562D3D8|nr:DUF29 domain-containing protein [Myxosarcina sp. GI1]
MTSQLPKTANQSLYDRDFCLWIEQTATKIRGRDVNNIDWENLLEEIEGMGKSEKNALESNLTILLMHLLKWKYQPDKRFNSWAFTITEHKIRIKRAFKHSPSLKRYFEEVFAEFYADARKLASRETGLAMDTFPVQCPFTYEEVIDGDRFFN